MRCKNRLDEDARGKRGPYRVQTRVRIIATDMPRVLRGTLRVVIIVYRCHGAILEAHKPLALASSTALRPCARCYYTTKKLHKPALSGGAYEFRQPASSMAIKP